MEAFTTSIYIYLQEITVVDNNELSRIEVIDKTPEGENFDYLRLKGTITYSIDSTYNIPFIEINFDGWFESSARLWPKNNKIRSNFLLLERTPPPSPSMSSFSSDSIVDTVF